MSTCKTKVFNKKEDSEYYRNNIIIKGVTCEVFSDSSINKFGNP